MHKHGLCVYAFKHLAPLVLDVNPLATTMKKEEKSELKVHTAFVEAGHMILVMTGRDWCDSVHK